MFLDVLVFGDKADISHVISARWGAVIYSLRKSRTLRDLGESNHELELNDLLVGVVPLYVYESESWLLSHG